MNAKQALEITLECLSYSGGVMNAIQESAQCGNFCIYWPKRDLNCWAVDDLKDQGYTITERAFEYEIRWDE